MENAVKGGLREHGRRGHGGNRLLSHRRDVFARTTAHEYAEFMHTTPWYEFPFAGKFAALWRRRPSGARRRPEVGTAIRPERRVRGEGGVRIDHPVEHGAVYKPRTSSSTRGSTTLPNGSSPTTGSGRSRRSAPGRTSSRSLDTGLHAGVTALANRALVSRHRRERRDTVTAIAPRGWDYSLATGGYVQRGILTNPPGCGSP